jgi:hypothetical protein
LTRVTPEATSVAAIFASSVRGSSSTSKRVSTPMSNMSCSASASLAKSAGESALGVPPPKWIWPTGRR